MKKLTLITIAIIMLSGIVLAQDIELNPTLPKGNSTIKGYNIDIYNYEQKMIDCNQTCKIEALQSSTIADQYLVYDFKHPDSNYANRIVNGNKSIEVNNSVYYIYGCYDNKQYYHTRQISVIDSNKTFLLQCSKVGDFWYNYTINKKTEKELGNIVLDIGVDNGYWRYPSICLKKSTLLKDAYMISTYEPEYEEALDAYCYNIDIDMRDDSIRTKIYYEGRGEFDIFLTDRTRDVDLKYYRYKYDGMLDVGKDNIKFGVKVGKLPFWKALLMYSSIITFGIIILLIYLQRTKIKEIKEDEE